jgi:methylmalonyl-CoA mutase N-terminal domain/subunit
MQGEIQNAAYEYQRSIERGDTVVIGVNRFRTEEEAIPTFRLDPDLEKGQVERLRAVRTSRDQSVTAARLEALEAAARSSDNLMPHILACAEVYASVGEISDRLRNVFGEHRDV